MSGGFVRVACLSLAVFGERDKGMERGVAG
jgi:hypothetical protein